MATTPQEFDLRQDLSTAETTLYTAPSATKAIIKHAAVYNSNTEPVLLTVKISDIVLFNDYIGPNEDRPLLSLINGTIAATRTIKAQAGTASSINIWLGGNEVV